jgi:hypothetical protein
MRGEVDFGVWTEPGVRLRLPRGAAVESWNEAAQFRSQPPIGQQ